MTSREVTAFRRTVWAYYKKNGRNTLPWRKTSDPYKILVSEVMLQQTQVPRVIEKYKEFLKKFPTVRILAKAPLSDVLKIWSGLGYNRRGKYLHDAAKILFEKKLYNNNWTVVELKLPGVGEYTRNAVRVFAFNQPAILLETNVRTAFIHHFFPQKKTISDTELLSLIETAAQGQDPRTWNWALMDYGSYLKKSGVRNNSKSAHYTKQSKFEGSLRQVRGDILRQLHREPFSVKGLLFDRKRVESALAGLVRDGLIVKEKGEWRIA